MLSKKMVWDAFVREVMLRCSSVAGQMVLFLLVYVSGVLCSVCCLVSGVRGDMIILQLGPVQFSVSWSLSLSESSSLSSFFHLSSSLSVSLAWSFFYLPPSPLSCKLYNGRTNRFIWT